MDTISAIILGLVQGITEFLPISSSGHLVLTRELLSLDSTYSLAFDGVLHLATTAAIVVYFWSDIAVLLQTAVRRLGRLPVNEKELTLLKALVLSTIPAGVLGLLFEDVIDEYLYSPLTVSLMLFMGAMFFIYAEWRYFVAPPQGVLTLKRGFLVGCFQVLALIPGLSRSGSTLAGGMLLGMSRLEAARFSFLMSIPITLGVGIKMLIELISVGGAVAWGAVAIGAVTSFLSGLVVIHFFLAFIRRYTLWPFVWYSIILSLLIAYIHFYA